MRTRPQANLGASGLQGSQGSSYTDGNTFEGNSVQDVLVAGSLAVPSALAPLPPAP